MPALAEIADIVKRNEPLAPYTHLRLGGPAEMLVQPRSREELSAVVRQCFQAGPAFQSGCVLSLQPPSDSEGVCPLSSCRSLRHRNWDMSESREAGSRFRPVTNPLSVSQGEAEKRTCPNVEKG
jgi:hypothetical protein